MENKFKNISKLIFDRWISTDLSINIIEPEQSVYISRSEFLTRAYLRQQQLVDKICIGDRVLISTGRGIEYLVDLFVTWSLGGVIVPFSHDAPEDYIKKLKITCETNIILNATSNDILPASAHPTIELVCENIYFLESSNEDLCAILFTSGSTGVPKGVMLSHYTLANNSLGVLERFDLDKDHLFVNIPFHFTSFICHFLACCFTQSTLLASEQKLFLADLPKNIISTCATAFGGAPIQIRWISEYAKHDPDINNTSLNTHLRSIISSGDFLTADIVDDISCYLPNVKIYAVYGLTELGGRFCVLDPGLVTTLRGCVGKPIRGLNIKITDHNSSVELAPLETGEIVAYGELLTDGYYRNEAATRKSLLDDGFRTGDLGYLDNNGFLYIKGRSDDVFKVNGQKVSSLLITEAMFKTGYFSDVAVVAKEMPMLGTIPVAYCVTEDPSSFVKGKVLKALRELLPNNHLPQEFILLDKIPRTGTGKLQRHKLV